MTLMHEIDSTSVTWRKLGEIASYRRGSFPQPYGEPEWYGGVGAMPFVQVADVGDNMMLVRNTKNKISKVAQPKSVFVPAGTVIVTLQGTIGRVAITQYDSYVDRTLAIFESFKIELDKKFFAYQLESKFKIEKETARGSTIKTITKEEFTEFEIAIPPLPIQQEIVNILDKFTQLEAELEKELEAELEARKVQYEYYKNELLENREKNQNTKYEELSKYIFFPKGRISASKLNSENYIGVDNILQNKQGKTVSTFVPKTGEWLQFTQDDILIGNIRPYLKKIWIANQTGGTNGDVVIIRIKDEMKGLLTPQFLFFILSSDNFFNYYNKHARGAKMPRGDKNSILKYEIPVPSLEQQKHITSILDKFDKLVNDISSGIPAEINARRKQYEYYREKLLTFKPLSDG